MAPLALPRCSSCKAPITGDGFNLPDFWPCPVCGTLLRSEVFPAMFRPVEAGREGETLVIEGESSCFYHPQKKAARLCDGCGRFMCSLCDCELHGQHYCPSCVEAGRTKGKIRNLQNTRVCYDGLALALTVYPIAFTVIGIGLYAMPITAPAALFVTFRYWNAPRSLVQPGRGRFYAAIILALLQICGAGLLIYAIVNRR